MAVANARRAGTPNVAFIRAEVKRLLPQYQTIRDCIAGETVIKEAKQTYLPKPNAADTSPENTERYKAYLTRAVFYNVTRRTLAGLLGQVFKREPTVKIPAQLEAMAANVTGTGISLLQSSQLTLAHVLAYSRGGVFADFTNTGGVGATREQVDNGEARPTIYAYDPLHIINWRVSEIGSKEMLTLVVLVETYPISDDGFEVKNGAQFRVLKLVNGVYVQEIWRDKQAAEWKDPNKLPTGNYEVAETITPTDATGQPLKAIPFWFVGSQNNDINPEDPNLYDIASLNVAHYRNSADYEECCYILGQATPVATGLTEEWVTNVLKGSLNFGSRGGIPLPAGADCKLLQAEANTMIKEAMTDKVEQMRSLGAKLVEDRKVQRTATESKQDNAAEGSVLSSSANNVSAIYLAALKHCALLMGLPESGIEFELNTDFDVANLTPEELGKAIDAWQKGAITFEEMRFVLRRFGWATVDDAEAQAAIEKAQIAEMEKMAKHSPEYNQPDPAAE